VDPWVPDSRSMRTFQPRPNCRIIYAYLHSDADIRTLEGRRIVHSVARHAAAVPDLSAYSDVNSSFKSNCEPQRGSDLANLTETLHDQVLVLREDLTAWGRTIHDEQYMSVRTTHKIHLI
jgi:hypothetical protein